MTSLEGHLTIRLSRQEQGITDVAIDSSRPINASKILIGKTPEQVLTMVPLLFNICGNAHGCTAYQALQQSLELTGNQQSRLAQNILVELETLREHCWRVLLDWPGFVGLTAAKHELAQLLQMVQRCTAILCDQGEIWRLNGRPRIRYAELLGQLEALEQAIDAYIFHGGLIKWNALQTATQLNTWVQTNESIPAALLAYLDQKDLQQAGNNTVYSIPELDDRSLRQRCFNQTKFAEQPDWQGHCYETGPLARQMSQGLSAHLFKSCGNGLLTRMVAKLQELAQIPEAIRKIISNGTTIDQNAGTEKGLGLAQVQAARGLLIHALQLERGVVADYRIIAPTEWNFHPQGVVAQGLKHLIGCQQHELDQQAEMWIKAVDPCVQYHLEWMG